MKFIMLSLSLILAAATSQAEVQIGKYVGTDKSGSACEFELLKAWYEGDLKHPLAERQPIMGMKFENKELQSVVWNLGHVQEVDVESGKARFTHSRFQEVIPVKNQEWVGAAVAVLEIDETEREGGHLPLKLVYFEDNYKAPEKSIRLECSSVSLK